MKTKNLVIILFFIFLIQSCKTKEGAVVFQLSEKVTCERIDTIYIGVPLNMTICGDDLFIGDFREPMIIHYHLKDRKTDRFLSKGRGPGETQPPVQLYANPLGGNKLYRHSKQAYDIGFYSLDSLSVFVPLFKVPYEYFNVFPYEKDRFLCSGRFNDGYRYRSINEEGLVVSCFGDYPDFLDGENLIPLDARGMFHQVRLANNYRKKKVVAASSHVLDIIDYSLDISKELIKRVLLASYDYEYESTRSGSTHNIWAQGKRGTIQGETSAACDDTYIYLLFDPGFVREENQEVKKEIWILDWDGHPVKKMILDADVKQITADSFSDNHTVYGLAYENHNNDEHYIIVKVNVKL